MCYEFLEKLNCKVLTEISSSERLALAKKLISIYDAPFSGPRETRFRAARLCGVLATLDGRVLEAVLDNAKRYADSQHCCDAFPYSPNSFEVLAEVPPQARLCGFLHAMVDSEFGVARAAAAAALKKLEGGFRESGPMLEPLAARL